jgi:hypothetical protein
MIYGVYANEALVHWPPSKIFGDEIKVIASAKVIYIEIANAIIIYTRLLVHSRK